MRRTGMNKRTNKQTKPWATEVSLAEDNHHNTALAEVFVDGSVVVPALIRHEVVARGDLVGVVPQVDDQRLPCPSLVPGAVRHKDMPLLASREVHEHYTHERRHETRIYTMAQIETKITGGHSVYFFKMVDQNIKQANRKYGQPT